MFVKRYLDYIQLFEKVGDIRSLSIVVPTGGCVNNCKFCVSKLHHEYYEDKSKNSDFYDEYFKKLEYVKERGCIYAILTGTGEPLQNRNFLKMVGELNKRLDDPFILEIQTSGVMLTDRNLDFLKNEVGVTTISLSVSDIFDDANNMNVIGVHKRLRFGLDELCSRIKSKGFILRLSVNMIDVYDNHTPQETIDRLLELNPDQVIFRVLWHNEEDNEINRWIRSNSSSPSTILAINDYIKNNGKYIGNLPTRYDINGVSIVVDDDCMARKKIQQFRYLILREDCNLYSRWDSDIPIKM